MSAIALSHPMNYVHTDVPEGMTLRDWRAGQIRSRTTVTPLSGVLRRVRRSRRARQRHDANVAGAAL